MLDQSTRKEPSDRGPANDPRPRPNQQTNAPDAISASNVLHTKWSYLGFVYASPEGFVVRFGIDQERYLLKLTQPNYNAMFSVLLGCWLDRGSFDRIPEQGGDRFRFE